MATDEGILYLALVRVEIEKIWKVNWDGNSNFPAAIGVKQSRMDQVKLVKDSLQKI